MWYMLDQAMPYTYTHVTVLTVYCGTVVLWYCGTVYCGTVVLYYIMLTGSVMSLSGVLQSMLMVGVVHVMQ